MTTHEQHSVVLEDELQQARQEPPPFYRVLLLNDDFTPMDFVVHLLQTFSA